MALRTFASWSVVVGMCLVVPAAGAAAGDDEGHERIKEFVKKVEKSDEATSEAAEELEKAIGHYVELLGAEAANRADLYDDAMKSIEKSEKRSEEMGKRLREMHQESERLFKNWKKSIKDIQTGSLRDRSEKRLNNSREEYGALHGAGLDARSEMDAVLQSLRDHMLYLKHDLNDSSAASLKKEEAELSKTADQCIARLAEYSLRAQQYAVSLSPE